MYNTIKLIHIGSAILSFAGFFIRGILLLKHSPLFYSRLSKIAPHIVDTLLLVSAITLAILSRQYPLSVDWLTLKVIGLLFYIALGLIAFRFSKTNRIRVIAWLSALLVFILIVITAVLKPF